MKKTGFVSIIGRPNVGKSTLLNILIGYKLSIISSKPQTTRNNIKGIYNDDESQIVFIDTPGIHKAKKLFGQMLNDKAYKSYDGIDVLIFLTPSNQDIGPGDQWIIDKLKNVPKKIAIISKSDIVTDKNILEQKAYYLKKHGFLAVITTSNKDPSCKKRTIDFIKEFLDEGEEFYPIDQFTDKSTKFIVNEIIRESCIENLRHELPHSIAIVIDEYKKENKIVKIHATVFVEKESQKGIIIGANASKIKSIGKSARLKIQSLLDQKVHLDLNVKISKNWTKDKFKIKNLGY